MPNQPPEKFDKDIEKEINDIQKVKQDLELASKKAEEYLDGWKRAKADYLNLKKETEKRQQEIVQFASFALICELLPIYDHFKLALSHVPKDQNEAEWVKGFFHVKNQLQDLFKRLGIEEIKTVGEKFNPEFHEAVIHEKKEGFKTDMILEEVKSGYTWHGKVIQPAKVKVAK